MGLLDKVKDKATQATEMAKDAAAKGQAKLDDAQSKKAADGMLRDLGAAFYATQTGRATPTTEADMQRLVSALQQHEAEHGALTLAPESSAAAPTAAPAPRPPPPHPRLPRRRLTRPRHHLRHRRHRRCRPLLARAARRDGPVTSGIGCPLRRGVEQSGSSSGS